MEPISRRGFLGLVASAAGLPFTKPASSQEPKPDTRTEAAAALQTDDVKDAKLVTEAYKILREPLALGATAISLDEIARLQEIIVQIKKPQKVFAEPYTASGDNLTALIVRKAIVTKDLQDVTLKPYNLSSEQAVLLLEAIKKRGVKLAEVRSSVELGGGRFGQNVTITTDNNLLHNARSSELVQFLRKEKVQLNHKNKMPHANAPLTPLAYQKALWMANSGVLLHLTPTKWNPQSKAIPPLVKKFFDAFQ